ncbi:MAG: hypothetical protein GY773_01650, partial [Actinomycetia bacterium]|nr:hypothetical protein [Actinomycetes bacterium]
MNVITDRRKTQVKRWVETAQVPELPLVAPRLPPGIINDAWPVFGRVYPRTLRWPLNGSRAIVWATWHLCRIVTR